MWHIAGNNTLFAIEKGRIDISVQQIELENRFFFNWSK